LPELELTDKRKEIGMSDLIEFIKIEWTDIHHSRNQEWRFLAILIAAFAALFVTGVSFPLQIAITVFGLIISGMGIYISIAHWIIFYSKIQSIRECEKKLGIEVRLRRGPVPVQGMMVSAFFLLAGALFGWLIWLLSGNLPISSIFSGIVFIAGLLLCVLPNSPLRKVVERSDKEPTILEIQSKNQEGNKNYDSEFLKFPLMAELDDLVECLTLMGRRPLKLIANELRETESRWDKPKWSFVSSKGEIQDIKLLINSRGDFEFSIAGEHSNQDFHIHQTVFEIYISYSEIKIVYFSDGREKVMQVAKGALLVPPKIRHKVQLSGPTFVFQHAIGGSKVHYDKEIVK
jgi:hypothetical protein